MENAVISKPNSKGQVVIPKAIRDALGINAGMLLKVVRVGSGIYLYPIINVITGADSDDSYTKILEKTRGAWAGDDWPRQAARRRKIELAAARRRKRSW